MITPLLGSSIQRKTMAVITTEAAHGAISAQRAIRRPGNRWLNSCAVAIDIRIVMTTTHTTQTTVRVITPPRSGSANRWSKLRHAADPCWKPIES